MKTGGRTQRDTRRTGTGRIFDAVLDAARAESDVAARKALYSKAQEILWNEGGILIPYHKVILRAMAANFIGITDCWAGDLPWGQIGLN